MFANGGDVKVLGVRIEEGHRRTVNAWAKRSAMFLAHIESSCFEKEPETSQHVER
jgi:hypothetical protein